MTKEQFYNHIKEHGITLARTTEKFKDIPADTKLWFGHWEERISSYNDDTEYRNREFNYGFIFSNLWLDDYTGEFELVDEDWRHAIPDKQIDLSREEMTGDMAEEIFSKIPKLIQATTIEDKQYFIFPKSKYTLEQTEDLFIIKVK